MLISSFSQKLARKEETWEVAKAELNKILDKNSEGVLETKLVTPGTPSSRFGMFSVDEYSMSDLF